MNKEKILLIFQTKSRADYWFSWFRNNYQNYIILIKGITKEIHLKNGTILYFKTLEDNLRGLRYDKKFNGERLELLCLNYENKELHNKIDNAIEYLEDDDNFWIPDSYSEDKVKMIQEELKQILKDSDVDA